MITEKLITRILRMVNPDNSHYSFLIVKGKIRKVGKNNKKKTHTGCIKYYQYPYIHSEFAVLKNISYDIRGILVNIRRGRSGKLLNSLPCVGCQQLLASYCKLKVVSLGEDHVFNLQL